VSEKFPKLQSVTILTIPVLNRVNSRSFNIMILQQSAMVFKNYNLKLRFITSKNRPIFILGQSCLSASCQC